MLLTNLLRPVISFMLLLMRFKAQSGCHLGILFLLVITTEHGDASRLLTVSWIGTCLEHLVNKNGARYKALTRYVAVH